MVSCLGYLSTCYLAIKLEKFTKYPAGQIVKYKLNNNKKKKYIEVSFVISESVSFLTLFLEFI